MCGVKYLTLKHHGCDLFWRGRHIPHLLFLDRLIAAVVLLYLLPFHDNQDLFTRNFILKKWTICA